ncbi:MAG: hypothetical protein PVJ67_02095 [Candidatus Pacearchaeota archaeon]
MEMQIGNNEILARLAKLQADVDFIKRNMVDEDDDVLTDEEIRMIDESLVNEKEGKLISHEELKKELGL